MDDYTEDERAIANAAVAEYRMAQAAQAQTDAALAYHRTLNAGDEVEFLDLYQGRIVNGLVTRRGSIAGFAMVEGVEIRFEATDLIF